MSYTLFLDDIRVPADVRFYYGDKPPITICRSYCEAKQAVIQQGIPAFISFDHDLADIHYSGDYSDERTGYSFAKWLANYIIDNNLILPDNFSWHVHSMNPVGAKNIQTYMNNFVRAYT